MPRRQPAQVRYNAPVRRSKPTRHIQGAPKDVLHAVSQWERRHLWPGAVAEAFLRYRKFVQQPGRLIYGLPGGLCPCCVDYYDLSADDPRATLQEALAQMPKGKGQKLRRMVAELDNRLLARSLPDPWAPPQWPWWRRRCTW